MLNKEVFLIRQGREGAVVFVPLKGVVFKTDSARASRLSELLHDEKSEFNDFLKLFPSVDKSRLMDVKIGSDIKTGEHDGMLSPTSLTLFPTFDCNLRCIYCYSSAGETSKNMDWEMARCGIDFVLANAKRQGKEKSFLELHGGGEPTYNWEIVLKATSYFRRKARECGIIPIIKLVSNGLWNEEQRKWVLKNAQVLCISFDGPAEIQNIQRPMKDGKDSFEAVFRSVACVWEEHKPCVLRITVTRQSVSKLPQIVDFFLTNFPGISLDLEPLHICGRCQDGDIGTLEPRQFVENFILADKIAKAKKGKLFFSGFNLTRLRQAYCRVTSPHFILLPSGKITTCYEVSDDKHALADLFHYGHYNRRTKKFDFDAEKVKRLQQFGTSKNDPHCSNCFCQYHCGGNCLIKKLNPQTLSYDNTNPRCKITKAIGKYQLMEVFGFAV